MNAGSRQAHQSRDGGAAKATAPPFAPLFTSRDDTSIETDRTRGRIQAGNKVPSAASRRFDRREALRCTGDVIGPARGLRVGVRTAAPANSSAIARVSVTLRIRSLLRFVGMCPACSAERRHFTELAVLVHG